MKDLGIMRELITPTSRRSFLRASMLTVAGGAVAACSESAAEGPAAGAAAAEMPHGASAAPLSVSERAAEMDRMHEAGVKAFPAPTAAKGNQLMEPRLENGVKVYDLTASKIQWETKPGNWVEAWAYNGQVPGPQIRVREGDRVRINFRNELEQSTAIHFHGLELPNDVDGVPFITQPPVKMGETYTYEFTVPVGNAGSHMYHSHYNAAEQVGKGLLGAFIVEPQRPRDIERVDVDYVMILNDGYHGFTLNGKDFPATEPIVASKGQKVRIRFMNEGMMIHPMHLHGIHMTVIDKDGWPLPAPWKCDTLNVAPGERWDVIVDCKAEGTWAFHCHVLTHAEGQHGMFGMVTALVVT
jgi:FtsP/CotA-like multicopper oxidase with cupredoxin domain